ncbi:MAG: hypothetical protein ACPGID_08425 [Rubricella sp.]
MTASVATLWIGPRLTWIEVACLTSFAQVGHRVVLYSYDPIENAPDCVEQRDAREVMPECFMLEHWGGTALPDPRVHADIFRILMMRETDHVWVDSDAFALRRHTPVEGYLFAANPRVSGFVPNHVMRFPRNSPALAEMIAFVSARGTIPPWWTQEEADHYNAAFDEVSFATLPVGVTGPRLLGHCLGRSGEMRHSMPFRAFSPLLAREKKTLRVSPAPIPLDFGEGVFSIHLYSTGQRRRLVNRGGIPPRGSLLHEICERTGVDPAAHPIDFKSPGMNRKGVLKGSD